MNKNKGGFYSTPQGEDDEAMRQSTENARKTASTKKPEEEFDASELITKINTFTSPMCDSKLKPGSTDYLIKTLSMILDSKQLPYNIGQLLVSRTADQMAIAIYGGLCREYSPYAVTSPPPQFGSFGMAMTPQYPIPLKTNNMILLVSPLTADIRYISEAELRKSYLTIPQYIQMHIYSTMYYKTYEDIDAELRSMLNRILEHIWIAADHLNDMVCPAIGVVISTTSTRLAMPIDAPNEIKRWVNIARQEINDAAALEWISNPIGV